MDNLINSDTRIKVSSTSDKSVGKNNIIDGSAETCWTSQEGLPQYIQLRFLKKVVPMKLSFIFQGGFASTKVAVQALTEGLDQISWTTLTYIYPDDVNRRQVFDLDTGLKLSNGTIAIKLVFEQSSDFFGRITIYDLGLEGVVEP